jgi:glycosyltransferase involved in cell wall biosynthesis
MKISAVIITRNEARNIARCLKALSWVDEIILVDTDSTDDTIEIARKFGAEIHSLPWRGYGPTKQYAIERATGDWILSVDADEIVTSDLASEIRGIVNSSGAADGYLIPRRTNFIGRWIYHSQWSPDFVLRLFKRDRGKFTDSLVHEKIIVDGSTGRLKTPLLHYSYPDLATYFRKTAKYNELSGKDAALRGKKGGTLAVILRPVATFYRHFVFHLGFLDGWAGFFIGMLSAHRNYRKYSGLRKPAANDQ